MVCDGDQSCILEDPRTENQLGLWAGFRKARNYTCAHGCTPTPCPNFAMCQRGGYAWYFDCHGGRCFECNTLLGETLFVRPPPPPPPPPEGAGAPAGAQREAEECMICYDAFPNVRLPHCGHFLCGVCARKVLFKKNNDKCPYCRRDRPPPAWRPERQAQGHYTRDGTVRPQ